ncbi:MAG: ATP-binding cassette domain-containing protein [Bacteroidaceae bacterium]|nr:ATP-binding cassette domain-containing protein [Bacteroidaceae bacterium]
MNDIVLSSLLNLFALFGTLDKTDRLLSKKVLKTYLSHHFGVRDINSYLSLYTDLRDFYEDSDGGLDIDMIISNICSKLIGEISQEEQTRMLLRLMEFCAIDGQDNWNDTMFISVMNSFGITEEQYNEFKVFLRHNGESENVRMFTRQGIEGYIKTLYLKRFDVLLFSCHSKDQLMMNDVPLLSRTFEIWQRSGVLKSSHAQPVYYYQIMSQYAEKDGQNSHNEIVVKGKDINFIYSGGDNGIHNFSFELYSGDLVAVMGGSGAGKSTLLSLLNGTLLPQQGNITINGHDISEPSVKKLIGFVPQDDLLIEELTVYENLWFTGKLCFDSIADDELDAKVNKVLGELGLLQAKNLKVGSPINKYISGGQRKRLNIALELIREPAILFLDEPTSGLSSADAEMLVNLLKEQAYKGKVVVSIIHQPSSDVFKMFDRLWILDRGGYPVYDGNPIEAVTYFKRQANYADAETSTCPTCGNVNPEIIFNIIDEKVLSHGVISDTRKVSPAEWHERYLQDKAGRNLDQKPRSGNKLTSLPDSGQIIPNALRQVLVYLQRNMRMKITNRQYILITLLEAPLLALICSCLTRYAPPEGYTIMDNINLVSYYFMAIIVSTLLGMSGSAEEIIKDRALLKREKFLSLSYSSYIWSKLIFMGGVSLLQTFLFVLVGNNVMGINGMFMTWWAILFITSFLAGLTGLWLSQTLNSVVAIYITIPLLLIPQILLCGMVVTFSELTPHSKTGNVPAIGNVIPSRWAFEALAVTSFSDNEYDINFFEQDRERYEAQFYKQVYLYEMKSQLETYRNRMEKHEGMSTDHMAVIRNSLPVISQVCQLEEYNGDYSYASLHDYFDRAEKVLSDRGNKTTLLLDRKIGQMVRSVGMDEMKRLKRDNHNLRLENLVLNSMDKHRCKVVDGYIVPNSGFVYVRPLSHDGNAPFYSCVKIVGSAEIKTLWFNLSVLLIMCILASLCLFFNFPGRLLKGRTF